jgi:hypothetical protein
MRSSMSRSGAEVAGVVLIGGTDLGRGRSRRMERGRDGRREFGWGHAARARARWCRRGRGPSRSRGARAGDVGGDGAGETQSGQVTYTDPSVRTDHL